VHLARRGGRFTFQNGSPTDLVACFGAAPVRLLLPPCGGREARRLAILLAGAVEQEFRRTRQGKMAEDPRDPLIAELRATPSEERKTRKREAEIADRLQESVAALHGELAALRAELGHARGPEPERLPLFSELSPEFAAEKKTELPNSTYSRYTVPAALAAWLEICGDRPLLDYRPKGLS